MADCSQYPGQIMETQTRYHLNAAIENWRAELAVQPNLTAEVRRELETHLRDAIAGFQQRGLNDEESFWLACKRVGQPPQLGEEFVKANPAAVWRERGFCVVLVLFTFQIWNFACHFLLMLLLVGIHYFSKNWFEGISFSTFDTWAFYLAIVAFALFLVGSGVKPLIRSFQLVFPSRLIFILASLILILFIHNHHNLFDISGGILCIGMDSMAIMRIRMTSGDWISQFCTVFVLTESLALTLVILVAWLMPTRKKRKTPKHA